MADSSNAFQYWKGMDQLKGFVPGKWMLIVTIGLGVWAWYNHTVLVLVATGGLFISNVAASLVDGLIVRQTRDIEEVRQSLLGASNDDRINEFGQSAEIHDLVHTMSAECRVLREAINRIDPKAIVSMQEIRDHDEHARDRYEAHSVGERSPYDWPEPSVLRLQREIEQLRQRLG